MKNRDMIFYFVKKNIDYKYLIEILKQKTIYLVFFHSEVQMLYYIDPTFAKSRVNIIQIWVFKTFATIRSYWLTWKSYY